MAEMAAVVAAVGSGMMTTAVGLVARAVASAVVVAAVVATGAVEVAEAAVIIITNRT